MSDNKCILVLGGTGNYGKFIVNSLVAKNVPVRVVSRNAAKARRLLGDSPELVEGDITSADTMSRALEGVHGLVISISAMNPGQIRRMKAIEQDAVIHVLKMAGQAGVKRVVFISVYDIRQEVAKKLRLESARIKKTVEDALAQSPFNWTVLGAPPSMQLFFAMTRGSIMVVPGGGPKLLPSVSPVDLGEIAAQAVLRDDLAGLRLRVPGPDPLNFPGAAQRLSKVYGRRIRFRKIPLLLPKIAWWATLPLAPFSKTACFVHAMIGYVKLLNLFPQDLAAEISADHQRLRKLFNYTPLTLEDEARRRMNASED